MSYPQQIRWLAKWLAIVGLLLVLSLGAGALLLRARASDAQRVYDAVAIGDAWPGLPGFEECPIQAESGSVSQGWNRYRRVVRTPYLPLVWEIIVDGDGTIIGKHRYD